MFCVRRPYDVWLNAQQSWQDFGSFVQKAGQSVWLGWGLLRQSQIYPVNLLAHWKTDEKRALGVGNQPARSSDDPSHYARRMWG